MIILSLLSQDQEVDETRQQQLSSLRELCLPMLCFLLHTVLHTTEQFKECLALADIIASEEHQLYKVNVTESTAILVLVRAVGVDWGWGGRTYQSLLLKREVTETLASCRWTSSKGY